MSSVVSPLSTAAGLSYSSENIGSSISASSSSSKHGNDGNRSNSPQKSQIDRLDSLNLPDNQIDMDLPSSTLLYSALYQLNFADEKTYSSMSNSIEMVYITRETMAMAKLKDNLELGQKFLAMLYSYRGVARGIPQAQNQEQSQKTEMYKVAFEVLRPEIQKTKDLQRYCEESTSLIALVFKSLSPELRDGFVSSECLNVIARTLDLILVMDTLKNAKTSLNNDFSIYKRIITNLKGLLTNLPDETTSNHELYNFLATQNVFIAKTKEKIQAVDSYEEILIGMVNYCTQMFENNLFVTPSDKHMLLKSITLGLYLLDTEDCDVTKRKKLRLEKCIKIIKSNPVVPFFGDMTMTLNTLFTKTPKLSTLRWEADITDPNLANSFLLTKHIGTIREEYRSYLAMFVSTMTTMKNLSLNGSTISIEKCTKVYDLLLQGVLLLSKLSGKVLEQSAWKFNNPTNSQKNPSCPENAKLYEMAVRYNYSTYERQVLCEIVGFIKSLSRHLSSVKGFIMQSVQKHIYMICQIFCKTTLRSMVSHASKKQKNVLNLVNHVYNILIDKANYDIDENMFQNSKAKKDLVSMLLNNIESKSVGIAFTQLNYIRIILDTLTNERIKGMQGGFMKEKTFKDNHIAEVNEFLDTSFYFPSMMTLIETVSECGDLAELWYREFYLELTKEIQFPIEMSLPWILTNTSLETEYRPNTEYLLCPFDIYNDAANRALHKLKCRYLYDEIEAEVNLCFDQFIWKLSQRVFSHFRKVASTMFLDPQYKADMEKRLQISFSSKDFEVNLLSTIIRQNRVYLMGRYINISQLVGQYCNQHIRNCIDIAIARFESSDFTGIIELEVMLEMTKFTHSLISEFVELDSFENMLNECDESLSLVCNNGRIVTHAIQELISDILPNYCYNSVTQRFVRAAAETPVNAGRSAPPKCIPLYVYGTKHLNSLYQNRYTVIKNFIGPEHLHALVRVLGKNNLFSMFKETCDSVSLMVKMNINPYVKALIKGLPKNTKLPPFEFGVKGAFDYFKVILKPIIEYRDLKSGVFQVFRELGNMMVFFHQIDSIIASNTTMNNIRVHPYFESSLNPSGNNLEHDLKTVFAKHGDAINIPNGAFTFQQLGEELEHLYSESLNIHQTSLLFKSLVFDKLKDAILNSRAEWDLQDSESNKTPEQSKSFFRMWSAVLFSFCLPSADPNAVNMNKYVYGDGLLWSGAAILYLLREDGLFSANDFISFIKFLSANEDKSATTSDMVRFIANIGYIEFWTQHVICLLRALDSQSIVKKTIT